MHSFYCPDIQANLYTFNEEESKHCVRVLRLGVGDEVQIVDGRGGVYKARIIDPNHKACTLEVFESAQEVGKRSYYLHVAIAPTKSADRFEWFLEKATEIGIDEISPLMTEHSERKQIKMDRCDKIMNAAVKQCLISYRPKVNEMVRFEALVKSSFEGDKFIAYCGSQTKEEIKSVLFSNSRALVLIGPEGDFSPEEVSLALQNGFRPVTLGANRLRTETAGILVCAAAALSKAGGQTGDPVL